MKYTSAQAAKLIRTLNEEQTAIKDRERKVDVFVMALEEKIEDVRPDYDYCSTREILDDYGRKIRTVKHAMNTFNVTTQVPGFDMTIDQMLVYIPQLNEKKGRLSRMAARLPKERCSSGGYGGKTVIEYQYANYDIKKVQADLEEVTALLAKAQTALDIVNNTETMEIDLDA